MCLPELLEGHGLARASRRRLSWLRLVVRSWKNFVGLIIVVSFSLSCLFSLLSSLFSFLFSSVVASSGRSFVEKFRQADCRAFSVGRGNCTGRAIVRSWKFRIPFFFFLSPSFSVLSVLFLNLFFLSFSSSSRVSWLRPVVRSWKSFVKLSIGLLRSVVEIAPARQSFVRGNSESFSFSFSLLLFLFSLFSFSFHFSFSSSRVSWLRPVVRSWKSFVRLIIGLLRSLVEIAPAGQSFLREKIRSSFVEKFRRSVVEKFRRAEYFGFWLFNFPHWFTNFNDLIDF